MNKLVSLGHWFGTRKESIPSGETKEITVLASWTVTWATALEFGDSKPKFKSFIDKGEANRFAKALKDAYELIDRAYMLKVYQN